MIQHLEQECQIQNKTSLQTKGKQSERGSPPKTDEAAAPAKADAGTIADLEAQVAAQGNKVNGLIEIQGLHFITKISCDRFER